MDTSAFLALLDGCDRHHPEAARTWEELILDETGLITTNYVLVETFALLQRRIGMAAVRAFQEDIVPLLRVQWIDALSHSNAMAAFLASGRDLSLVDCSSFEAMRRLGIGTAFAFDRHFSDQGFRLLP